MIVTVDRKMPSQQNWAERRISVVILCCGSNRLRDLEALIPDALVAIEEIAPGQIVRVPQ